MRWRERLEEDARAMVRNAGATRLVVIFHGFRRSSTRMDAVGLKATEAFAQQRVTVDLFVPTLPFKARAFLDPWELSSALGDTIGQLWDEEQTVYDEVVLVGHSMGAIMIRRVFLDAWFRSQSVPGDAGWERNVRRIVLLAALNNGWSVGTQVSIFRSAIARVLVFFAVALRWLRVRLPGATPRCDLVPMVVRKGSKWMTDLRLGWLEMAEAMPDGAMPLVVQLLGSNDDLVSPEDDIDLATDEGYIYLDVPNSNHAQLVEVVGEGVAVQRSERLRLALIGTPAMLAQEDVPITDHAAGVDSVQNLGVTDVVFVMHGIRDRGYWTHKVARKCVKALGLQPRVDGRARLVVTETSSYGFFAMLPFLANFKRRDKAVWLIDRYVEDRARYPNSDFHYIGHSNGTYLLARALRDHPRIYFDRVVFAGSVVQKEYDWSSALDPGAGRRPQVKKLLNIVATADWVVAFFPRAIGNLGLGRVFDLGGAGHDGFVNMDDDPRVLNLRYVSGGHSAGRLEPAWSKIASFIATGQFPDINELAQSEGQTYAAARGLAGKLMNLGLVVFVALLVVLAAIGQSLLSRFGWEALVVYLAVVVFVGFNV